MASGYGNRSKWTVNELLTRNEQAKALGQKGLSNSQIGAGLEGAIGADLQAAGVHEQNLMQNKQNNQRFGLMQDQAKNAEKASTMGGYIKMGEGLYDQYKKGNLNTQALTADTPFQQNIVRPIQNRMALNATPGEPGPVDMYGNATMPQPASPLSQIQTDLDIGQLNTPGYAGGGAINDTMTQGIQAVGAEDAITKGAELTTQALEPAVQAEELATGAIQGALGTAGKMVGPIGAMAGAAMSVAGGNYAKAAVDLAIYGIGMCFGPIGMMVSLIVNLLPDSIMNPVYELFQ